MDHTSLKPPHLPVIAERNPFLYYPFIAAAPFLSLPISSTHSDGLSSPKSLHSPAIISPRFSNSSAQSQVNNLTITHIRGGGGWLFIVTAGGYFLFTQTFILNSTMTGSK